MRADRPGLTRSPRPACRAPRASTSFTMPLCTVRHLCTIPPGEWRPSRSCWPCFNRRAMAVTWVSNEQIPAEHAGHSPALARGRAERSPRASRERRNARARACLADAARRTRRFVRTLDVPPHPLGVRWADTARVERAGRRHGTDDILGGEGNGASWLRWAPQACWRPQESLCHPYYERPQPAQDARAACRGGEPDRRSARPFGGYFPCTQIIAFDYRKPGARRTKRRHADAIDPRTRKAQWRTAKTPKGLSMSLIRLYFAT